MRSNSVFASTLFTMLCLGGIAVMCSQSSLFDSLEGERPGHSERASSADPGESLTPVFESLVPATLERGAKIHVGTTADRPAERRLRLR